MLNDDSVPVISHSIEFLSIIFIHMFHTNVLELVCTDKLHVVLIVTQILYVLKNTKLIKVLLYISTTVRV